VRLLLRAAWAAVLAGVFFGLATIPFDGAGNAPSRGFWFAVWMIPAFVVILVVEHRREYFTIARRFARFIKPSS